jgi:cell wall-associated NlpC family hydrolase
MCDIERTGQVAVKNPRSFKSMTTPTDVLDVARSYLGVKESPPNSNRQLFGEWYGVNGVAWCAIFVSYCFNKAGLRLPPIQSQKGFAYCQYGVNYFKEKGKFDQTPRVGDIVFFDWQRDGHSDHVGIVEEVGLV